MQGIVGFFLLIPGILLLSVLVRRGLGLKPIKRIGNRTNTQHIFDFGIVITAYREAEFIRPLIDSINKQGNIPYHIYVVADNCTDPMPDLSSYSGYTILIPSTPLHSKVKSIQYAIDRFERKHEVLLIIDHDNLLHPDFLKTVNSFFQAGFEAVQANFRSKNEETIIAKLDSISDKYNFFVEREARMEWGLHSSVWGSGISLKKEFYDTIVYPDTLGGFDKMLQYHLAKSTPQIAFASKAILYDEKVSNAASLEKQRGRWLNAQFKYTPLFIRFFFESLAKGNLNNAYCALMALRPPLFILLGLSFCFILFHLLAATNWTGLAVWFSLMFLFFINYLAIIYYQTRDVGYLKAACLSPVFMFHQARSLFKMGKAKKSFVPTTHQHLTYIDELLSR
jgi:cellulose synthase/poly-beta-1,6-N-acetylglucosamine synthase-like glycosyltransferase